MLYKEYHPYNFFFSITTLHGPLFPSIHGLATRDTLNFSQHYAPIRIERHRDTGAQRRICTDFQGLSFTKFPAYLIASSTHLFRESL